VIAAMATIAREQFLPEAIRPLAYADRAMALGDGRFLTPPATLGKLLTEMDPQAGQRALVIGAGSGYSSAVLASIGLDVVALESAPALAARARDLGVDTVEGPLEAGWPAAAPYEMILIDGAIETIPEAVIGQLNDGGQLGAALIDRGVTRLIVGRKAGGGFGYRSLGDAGTPPLPGFRRPAAFTF